MPHRRYLAIGSVVLLLVGLMLPLCAVVDAAASDLESQRAAALARVNQWRAAIGVTPIMRHPALDQAAQAHANYYKANSGSGGAGIHNETRGLPGFTGVEMSDRATVAGYPSSNINEDIGLSGDLLGSLNWFISTVNHRLPILDPRYVHIGFGMISEGDAKIEVVDFGAPEWDSTATPTWEQWPPDGAKGIATSFSGESPNALTGVAFPCGAPITLKYLGSGSVAFSDVTITAGGQTVASAGAVGSGWLSRNTYIAVTTKPMPPGTDYRVTFSGTAGGEKFSRSWGFRTRSAGEDENVVPGATGVNVPTATPTALITTAASPAATATTATTATSTATATATMTLTATPPAVTATTSVAPVAAPTATATATIMTAAKARTGALPVFPPAPSGGTYRLPNGVGAAPATVGTMWSAGDGPVAANRVVRSWLYGPDVVTKRGEPYSESAGGSRTVYYFDKARMELTGTALTNGLLVTEMISGQIQVGNNAFNAAKPATLPIAGDMQNNTECPTYATLAVLASYGAVSGDRRAPDRTGKPITATLNASGTVGDDASRTGFATVAVYETTLGHNIPDVFAGWLQSLPDKWQTLVGLPISEPYWTTTRVGGTVRPVLMQAFERRVLTYTPDNAPAWQVEMGNVGLHFLLWQDGLLKG